MILHFGENVAK